MNTQPNFLARGMRDYADMVREHVDNIHVSAFDLGNDAESEEHRELAKDIIEQIGRLNDVIAYMRSAYREAQAAGMG